MKQTSVATLRMLLLTLASLTFLNAITSTVFADEAKKQKTESDVIQMFNGKDLTGWTGREDLWSVENDEIVGRTSSDNPLKSNSFLVWEGGQPDNFELVLFFRIESGNSGIQYRSKVMDKAKFVVGGYQADIDFSNQFAGILYEERGRGILAKRGEKTTISNNGKRSREAFGDAKELGNGIHPGKWNEFRVVANGNHLEHYINGAKTAELIDDQPTKASSEGVIAFQLHVGKPMVVRFKNISLRKLK